MKKVKFFLFVLLLGITLNAFSQTAPKDFYAGKWEIALSGTPNGEVKFLTDLTRKDGKLTGVLVNASDTSQPKRPITKVEENGDHLAIFFESSQGGEISINLAKVDNENLKGTLMAFEAKATRIKN